MSGIALWHIAPNGPAKLAASQINLEKDLEGWIERDPALLQEGLTIIGRQISIEGGSLDLLALDPQGRWVVIEIKRGLVYRETIAQALDYASCVATMPSEELAQKVAPYLASHGSLSLGALLAERGASEDSEQMARDVTMFVVGTGQGPGLERIVDYLSSRFDVPVSVVLYQVFELAGGERVLVRELTESDVPPVLGSGAAAAVDGLCARADQAGVGPQFRRILEWARRHDFYPRPFKHCIMYTPPSRHDRALITVNAVPATGQSLTVWVAPGALAEFYPVEAETAERLLGKDRITLTPPQVESFVARLDQLFADPQKATEDLAAQ